MKLFGSKSCSQCEIYAKELDALKQENEALTALIGRLKSSLKQLKEHEKNIPNHINAVHLYQDDIAMLFRKIKQSNHDADMKRYLRAVLMLIERSNDGCLYQFLLKQL